MADDLYIQPEAFEFEFESCLDEFEPEFGTGGEFETGQRAYETDFGEFVTFGAETPTTLQLEGGNPVDARWVQNSLNRLLGLRLAVDGIVGPATRSAIRTFQQKQGLTVDGVVGPKTQAAMIAAGAPPVSVPSQVIPTTFVPPQATTVACQVPTAAADTVLDNFVFNKSDLVPKRHASQLAALARTVISSQRTQRPVKSFLIVGHTDPVGSDNSNLQLGLGRARAVLAELSRTLEGMSPGITSRIKFAIATCGERQPKATPALSRRAEIFLLKSVWRPPQPSRLRPERWAPILSAAKSANATLRVGNAVRTLIDGRETFEEMVSDIRATNGDRDYVYLLAWDITDDFALIPGDASSTMRRLMADASARGVQIRAMLWAKPPLLNLLEVRRISALSNGAAIRDAETPQQTP